jgi:hypothetical protein
VIVLLAAVALLQIRETAFWPDRWAIGDFFNRWRRPARKADVGPEPEGHPIRSS